MIRPDYFTETVTGTNPPMSAMEWGVRLTELAERMFGKGALRLNPKLEYVIARCYTHSDYYMPHYRAGMPDLALTKIEAQLTAKREMVLSHEASLLERIFARWDGLLRRLSK